MKVFKGDILFGRTLMHEQFQFRENVQMLERDAVAAGWDYKENRPATQQTLHQMLSDESMTECVGSRPDQCVQVRFTSSSSVKTMTAHNNIKEAIT